MSQELSAPYAYIYRWVIPALLTIAALAFVWLLTIAREPTAVTAVLAACLAGLCMIIARIFDRAKRVWLDTEALRVSDLRQEIEIDRHDVADVSVTPLFWPARVRIRLQQPTVFGNTVYFFPPLGRSQAVLEQLQHRQTDR